MSYYGTSGTLVLSNETKAAILKNEYNNKGERVKMFFYGTDMKPCKCKEGWSSSTYEYDSFGNTVKQCFFDVNGKPTDSSDMVPVGIAKYDKWGNMIYVAAQDGHGKFINRPGDNWAICRNEYDNKNNLLSVSYYNPQDKPTLSSEGYHKARYVYDNQNRKIEESYYGTNGQPILVNNYHKETIKYAENSNNIIEKALFDAKGKPVNSSEGWHKVVLTYNKDVSIAETKKYYRANGSLLETQKWNGQEWVLVEKQYNWQQKAKEYSAKLPLDFGSQAFGLTIQSLTITGENSCEFRMTITSSIDNMSTSDIKKLKEVVNAFVD